MNTSVVQPLKSLPEGFLLKHGAHGSFEQGACVMEAVAFIAGEPFSDHPECASPSISAYLRGFNDRLPDDATRTRLLSPLISKLVGSRGSEALEEKRRWMLVDYAIRVAAPRWLEVAKLTKQLTAKPSTTVEVKTVEVPVSIKEEIEMLERAIASARQLGDALAQKQQVVVAAIDNALSLLEPTRVRAPPFQLPATSARTFADFAGAPKLVKANRPSAQATGPANLADLKRPALTMLCELAARYPKSLTRRALATRATLRAGTGNFRTLLSSLRVRGVIEEDEAGDLRATALGLESVGVQRPKHVDEIVTAWNGKLKGKARQMLQALLEQGNRTRAELAAAVHLEHGTGNFRTLLSTLRTAGLIDEQGGRFFASQALYLGQAA